MTRPIASALTALLVVALVASTAVAPVAADHGEEADTAFSNDETNWLDMAKGAASGISERVSYTVSSLFGGETQAADDSRDDAIQTFNQYNTTFVDYLNARGIHDGEVVKVTFVQNGERSTAFIVADYNTTSEEYDSAEAVKSTDRSVDHKIRLQGMAADNADDELERFHDDFAEPDTDITTKYASEMASKYARLIDEPFTQ